MRSMSVLLVAPALLAQAPAPAPSYAQKAKEGLAAITPALIKENPGEAVAKAKALLPEGGKLAFDKTNVQTAMKSAADWRAQLDVQTMIINATRANGEWETAKEAAEKSRDLAKSLQVEAFQPLNDYKQLWVKAQADSKAALEELSGLEAKSEKTPEESSRYTFLKGNEATYKGNFDRAAGQIVSVDRNLKVLADQTHDFDKVIESLDKLLKDQSDDMAKFKTKSALSVGMVKNVGKHPENVDTALVMLRRALFLDPSNKEASHRVDVLLGKAEDKPEKPTKKAGAKAPRKKGK